MARIVAIILCMTLIVGACVVAVGSTFFGWDIFGEQTDTPHTHQYSEEVTKAPTCTEEGVKTFTCSGEGCDKPTYTEPIEKLPHTEVKLDGKAATCTEAGLSEGKKCSECGETTVKQETIPATGHTEETLAAVAPTCTENGLTEGKKCSACGTVLTAQNNVPATGHKYDDEYDATCNNEGCDFVRDAACRHSNTETLAAKAATCTETGLTEGLKCKDCEELLTKQEIVPVIAHSWTAATCTAPKTCSVCSATEGEKLDHNWKPATCTDPKTCQRENCGVTEGDALGHRWNDATCTAPQICSVCTATQGEALGHKWNDATCDTPKTCGTCKVTEGDKLGHDYDEATYVWSEDNKTCTATKVCKNDAGHVVTETATATIQTASATCTAGGSVTYTTSFNKEGFTKQIETVTTEKLDHDLSEPKYTWNGVSSCTAVQSCSRVGCNHSISETERSTSKVKTPATCNENGVMVYTVEFENFAVQTKDDVIPATGKHTEESIPAVPSTCITHGKTEGKKCSVCGTILQAQGEAPLAAHTYTDKYDATCNVEGCDFERDAECAHTETITLDEVPATCLESGLEAGVQCANEKCGEILSGRETISARGHDLSDATCIAPKTCQRDGCDYTEGTKRGHLYGAPTYSFNFNYSECTAVKSCTRDNCDKRIEEKTTNISSDTTPAGCTTKGQTVYTAVFSDTNDFGEHTETVTLNSTNHNYVATVISPTCTTEGYTSYKCSKCDNSYTGETKVPARGHSFTKYESNNDATCLVNGTKTAKCDRCDETDTVADTGSAKGHSFTDYKSNNDATCTADGTETAKCNNCDATDKRTAEGSKLAHTYKNVADDQYLKSAATCTANAVYYQSCSICHASSKDSETPVTFEGTTTDPTNHTGTEVNGGTADIHTKYSCCGAAISSNHEYKSEITTSATCTEKGTTTYTCACGHSYTAQDVNKLDHSYTGEIKSDGNGKDTTHSFKCVNGCNQYGGAVKHTWNGGVETSAPTCEGTGVNTYTCTADNCGATYTETVSATGHTYDQEVVDAKYLKSAATCTAKATYYKSCKCGAAGTETFENGEKLAHSYGTPSYEWADDYSTCTATKGCVNDTCDDTVTETVNATSSCTATCTSAGTTTYTADFTKDGFVDQEKSLDADALGHTYGENSGECSRCGNLKYVISETPEDVANMAESGAELDSNTTIVTYKCTFTLTSDGIRILSSNTNNGYVIIKSAKSITALTLSVGNTTDQIVVYGSNDEGGSWTEVGRITPYRFNEKTIAFADSYEWLKLDVAGTEGDAAYLRNFTLSFCDHSTATAPTCQTPATCSECGADVYGLHGNIVTDEAVDATCEGTGLTEGSHCEDCGTVIVKQETVAAVGHNYEVSYSWSNNYSECTATKICTKDANHVVTETVSATLTDSTVATCTVVGSKIYTSDEFEDEDFEAQTKEVVVPTIPHDWYHGVCQYECGTSIDTTIVFEFGDNGTGHADGTDAGTSKSYTESGYSLDLTSMSKVYSGASDANGNSCLKLGTSSAVGSFGFTVPDDITKVIIYVAQYKDKTTKIEVNGTAYTITTSSDSGEYTAIEIDTTTTKTISFTTVSGGVRCMINTIVFSSTYVHKCTGGTATCETAAICDICGKAYGEPLEHTLNEELISPTCQSFGYAIGEWCYSCKKHVGDGEAIAKVDHKYEDGKCIWCNTEGHECEYSEFVETVAPTCIADGYTVYKCAYCENTENRDPVDKLGHTTLAEDAASNEDLVCDNCTYEIELSPNATLTIKQAIALGNRHDNEKFTEDKYYITGTIISIVNTEYGNMNISDGEKSLYIYGLYNDDGSTRYDAMATKPAVGDQITIYTIVGRYNNAPQAKNAWLTAHIAHECAWSEATCQAPATCSICGATTGTTLEHVDGDDEDTICDNGCGNDLSAEVVESWVLVTDISQLGVGKQIVIVSAVDGYALGTTQNSNNRSAVVITKEGDTVIIGDNVQIITLEAGTKEGTFAFNVGNGYLYAASTSNNYLRTETSKSNNSSWTIVIGKDSSDRQIATVTAQGTNSVNVLKKNTSSALFSCYTTAQKDIAIYVKTVIADSGSGEGGEDTDTPTKYTVTFNNEGVETEVEVNEGEKVAEPTSVPTKDGFTFDGWYNGDTKWNFETDTVTSDITLTAKWEETASGGDESETPVGPTLLATFEMGTRTSDSNSATTTYTETVGNYTLEVSDGVKMYEGYDSNTSDSGLKFGSSSATGSCTISVGASITKVIIYVTAYKTEASSITVNDVSYSLTATAQAIEIIQPNAGAEWDIDVVGTKKRFYIDTIEFYG